MPDRPCVFCEIVAGRAPAEFVSETAGSIAIIPLRPVTDGHVLFIPRAHVSDAATKPGVSGEVFADACVHAARRGQPFNLITSAGSEATQTVFHLHIHYVPRRIGDELALPWTGRTP